MKRARMLVLLAVALVTVPRAAAQPRSDDLYLVTLRPEAAVDRLEAVAEDLARSYGGTVVEARAADDSVLMHFPSARLGTIARDPRVTSIGAADGSSSGRPRIAGDVAEVVPWRTGVRYSYDGAGNVTAIGSDRFVYDVASRLVQANVNGTTRTYEYDSYGNRTKCTQGTADCQVHTIDASNNRINGTNNHDTAGNVTKLDGHEYAYDALNMQTRDSDTASGVVREYVYTADDERIAVYTVDQWWRWTIRDTSGKVLREYMSQDGPNGKGTDKWQWAKDYVWRDGILLATRQKPPGSSGGVTYHYHVDHLGTPRRITDAGDRIVGFHDYFAFGPETTTGKSEPSLSVFKYTGHERDITDSSISPPLDYMHARYYSPTLGRFLSIDPKPGTAANSHSWNRYTYTFNNPLRAVDPDGRQTLDYRVLHVRVNLVFSNTDSRQFLMSKTLRQRVEAGAVKAQQIFSNLGIALTFHRYEGSVSQTRDQKLVGTVQTNNGNVDISSFLNENHGKALTVIASGDVKLKSAHGGTQFVNGVAFGSILPMDARADTVAHELGHSLGNRLSDGDTPAFGENEATDVLWFLENLQLQMGVGFSIPFEEWLRKGAEQIQCEVGIDC